MTLSERERKNLRDNRDFSRPQLPIFDGDKIVYGYCDTPKRCNHLEVNHIVNQADGGEDEPRNLITIPKCIHVGVCPSKKIKDKYAR